MAKRFEMNWKKYTLDEINDRIQLAIDGNINFESNKVIGVPGTFLDEDIFHKNARFLKESPFLRTLIANPNHIGCHTLTENNSEPYFYGTQQIEREVIGICSEEIFKAEAKSCDGYIAPGGTEANIQAMWVYRNLFIEKYNARPDEIAVVYSKDSHYSMPKGANILSINTLEVEVHNSTRAINLNDLENQLNLALANGIKYFILIQNMATTMFGSIDDIESITAVFDQKQIIYRLHIDAAFGGFIVPFSDNDHGISFKNEKISSITLDAHKMLQTPYGTGVLLMRKNLLKHATTKEARYVKGGDVTLCGSRSGANAVALWMILSIHGSDGWKQHIKKLINLTSHLCRGLDSLGIHYYRNPSVNIVTIRAEYIPLTIAKKYGLVPNDTAGEVKWWKVVVMQHVQQSLLDELIEDLKEV